MVRVKLRQMKKFTFSGVSPTGHKRMDMRIPMEQLPKRLDGRSHAGHDIRQVQHAPDFGLDAIPSAGGKFVQELAMETCVNSQAFGDGKNHLSARNGKTNICGDVDACHKCAFLVARDAAKGSGAIHVNIAHETKSPWPLAVERPASGINVVSRGTTAAPQ
jgi:hypothetical protein